jgi:hypothetical protein
MSNNNLLDNNYKLYNNLENIKTKDEFIDTFFKKLLNEEQKINLLLDKEQYSKKLLSKDNNMNLSTNNMMNLSTNNMMNLSTNNMMNLSTNNMMNLSTNNMMILSTNNISKKRKYSDIEINNKSLDIYKFLNDYFSNINSFRIICHKVDSIIGIYIYYPIYYDNKKYNLNNFKYTGYCINITPNIDDEYYCTMSIKKNRINIYNFGYNNTYKNILSKSKMIDEIKYLKNNINDLLIVEKNKHY